MFVIPQIPSLKLKEKDIRRVTIQDIAINNGNMAYFAIITHTIWHGNFIIYTNDLRKFYTRHKHHSGHHTDINMQYDRTTKRILRRAIDIYVKSIGV